MAQSTVSLNRIGGPDEPFDINPDEATFANLTLWAQQYGDVVSVKPQLRKSPAFVLNHPDLIHHVLVANHRNYAKGVGFERVKMLLGNGIIVSEGDFWRSQRRMIQPAFRSNIIAALSRTMARCNQAKLAQWNQKAVLGKLIDLTSEMSELALEVILRSLFSHDLDALVEAEGGNPFVILVEDGTRDLKLAMRFRALTQHVAAIMAKRREQSRIEHDFLSLLMETRDKDTQQPMSDKALIDEVMTIIVAGHETTAGTLNWTWFLLSQHKEVEALLHAEVDALPESPVIEDLPALCFTRQVVDETLRLYPPVWLFSRKAIGDDVLDLASGNVEIAAGSDIFLCPYLLHRDQRFWDQPEQFNPARFLESQIRHRNAYFPFSLGSRRCIGEFFSMVDMQLHIALLARHITLHHVPDKPIDIEPHINLRARHNILMKPVLRAS